jgi:hypothetical protein
MPRCRARRTPNGQPVPQVDFAIDSSRRGTRAAPFCYPEILGGEVVFVWLIEKWDLMVYRLAHHSMRRMCERNQGFAYLFELWIREWRAKNPIPKELESATEKFFESLKSSRRN